MPLRIRASAKPLTAMVVQYSKNKGFAEDLTEGKFSFPVVHGVRANLMDRQVLSKCIGDDSTSF